MNLCIRLGLPEEEAPFFKELKSERVKELRNERMLEAILRGETANAVRSETSNAVRNRFVRKWHTMQERMRNAERIKQFSPAYARHMKISILLSGLGRLFAKDRHWE